MDMLSIFCNGIDGGECARVTSTTYNIVVPTIMITRSGDVRERVNTREGGDGYIIVLRRGVVSIRNKRWHTTIGAFRGGDNTVGLYETKQCTVLVYADFEFDYACCPY